MLGMPRGAGAPDGIPAYFRSAQSPQKWYVAETLKARPIGLAALLR